MNQNTIPPELWIPAFGVLVIGIVALVIKTKQRWNRLANHFGTRERIDIDEGYDNQVVHIDGQKFRHLMVVPTAKGLYLSHYGLLPMIMVPQRILIPWTAMSPVFIKVRHVGFLEVPQSHIEINKGATTIRLQLTTNIVNEILNRGYLKRAGTSTEF